MVFHELADPIEQRDRFITEQDARKAAGLPSRDIDPAFLEALKAGLPDCAGVALGLDRVLMIKMGTKNISDTLSFA